MSSDDILHIRVKNKNHGQELMFKIKNSTELKKVFEVVAERQYKTADISSIIFFFNDKLISETDTAQSLKLEEDDQICCYTHSEFILFEILDKIVKQSNLSFSDLLERIKDIPRCAIHDLSFVHRAVRSMAKNTPLEFIEHLRDFPDEVSKSSGLFCPHGTTQSYLLHLACYNEDCPTLIIKLLVEKYPDALGHFCVVERGVKVHGDDVKLLVEAYPQEMLTADNDDIRSTPIYVVISNSNIKNKCEIITQILDSEPSSIRYVDREGRTLLATACSMSGVDSLFEVVQLLLAVWPEALMIVDHRGCLPIHYLCCNSGLDDSTSIGLLHLLISDDATLMSIADDNSLLPIHYAVYHKSANFCKELLSLCPEMIRAEAIKGLPIHIAARFYRVNAHLGDASTFALRHMSVIELLLECDPSGASVPDADKQRLPLHVACIAYYEYRPIVQLLFDQHPEAIWARDVYGNTPLDLARKRKNKKDPNDTAVIDFLEDQLKYVTEDMVLDGNESTAKAVFWSNLYKCTQDGSGSLPLHHSLQNNASLGVIKVLLYGNSDTLWVANHQGLLPIHIACQYSSVKVVNYLLDKQMAVVRACNSDQKRPIHLLCESGGNDESVAYVETIWRMLLANPEL